MGDSPTNSKPVGNFANTPPTTRSSTSQPLTQTHNSENEPWRGQQRPSSQTSQAGYPPMQSYPSQQHAQPSRPETFNMNSIGATLPNVSYHGYGQFSPQRYPEGPASPALLYQMQNTPQYAGIPNVNPSAATYNMPYQPQYLGVYSQSHTSSSQHLQPSTAPGGHYYHNQGFVGQSQQSTSPYLMQVDQYSPQSQGYVGNSSQYSIRGSFSGDSRLPAQQHAGEYLGGPSGSGAVERSGSFASTSQSSVVRGPPRKPRQSGHAIWIGNLPPQTELMNLVLHVCKEAPGLESLFLISKSNCAFANFKDEATCAAAQQRIHDSKFQTIRLVSRLRKSSVGPLPGTSVPTGPAALTAPQSPVMARTPSPEKDTKSKEVGTEAGRSGARQETKDASLPKDKFFVVKSLTVEDLELSVRNGIWATQSHNEETLNKAYQTADNVYLIFSANKSGEYFGYARMISEIDDDPISAIEFAPKAQVVEDPDLPKAIPTPATEFVPKGRIIDDSARGTIFWEVERDELADEEDEILSNKSEIDEDSPPTAKAWGKPFKIEWISTTRLPFYRTRGLRNPWNSNREVKIARDGTELEPDIGRRLLSLFHRAPEPGTQALAHMHGHLPMPGYPRMHHSFQ